MSRASRSSSCSRSLRRHRRRAVRVRGEQPEHAARLQPSSTRPRDARTRTSRSGATSASPATTTASASSTRRRSSSSSATYLCRGPQNDVSLWEHNGRLLLFLSIDTPQTKRQRSAQSASSDTTACGGPPSASRGSASSTSRIPPRPVLKGVYTDCGSHTHTLVPDLANNRVLIYISSYPGSSGPAASRRSRKISIVQVPLNAPGDGERPLPAAADGDRAGLPRHHGLPGDRQWPRSCATEGQLWDITDPANPGTLNPVHIDDPGVNYWHSAAFTWDGQYVVFDDESFTGTCQPAGDGKIRIYRVSDGRS